MYPIVRLHKGNEKAILGGYPWALQGDFAETGEMLLEEPGFLAELRTPRDAFVAIATCNLRARIALRVLTLKREIIDAAFFRRRFQAALARREKIIPVPYYRLVHSESDQLPGLIVDRYGDILVCQVSTQGMERLRPLWLAALREVIAPEAVLLRNDVPAREMEGLAQGVERVEGAIPPLVELREYNRIYLADLMRGQKTGWFYDQRDNRERIGKRARGKTLLDVYAHSGGFSIAAMTHGAASATLVDSSAWALDLARRAAARNGVPIACLEGPAFETMEALDREGRRFGIVVADPPAFIPSRKDLPRGLKGYEKVTRLAVRLVAPGGELFIASCSHHATPALFRKAVMEGVRRSGRKGHIEQQTGAAPDHPVHPQLPQSEYLKGLLIRFDD